MAKCVKCGAEMGDAKTCQSCGQVHSEGMLGRGVDKVARATGTVLQKSVQAGETVYNESKPVVKTVAAEGKKGLGFAKGKTLELAKKLKKES